MELVPVGKKKSYTVAKHQIFIRVLRLSVWSFICGHDAHLCSDGQQQNCQLLHQDIFFSDILPKQKGATEGKISFDVSKKIYGMPSFFSTVCVLLVIQKFLSDILKSTLTIHDWQKTGLP